MKHEAKHCNICDAGGIEGILNFILLNVASKL